MSQTEAGKPLIVGLVENDPVYLEKITKQLAQVEQIETVLYWESAEMFWHDPKSKDLDLLFLDIKLPGIDGVELAGRVIERNPETSIVMLSNLNSDKLIFQALRNGATGYLLKSELKDIGETVQTVIDGGATITPVIALKVLSSFRKSNPVAEARLTHREKQILELMVGGKTIPKVSELLGITANTVHHHAKNIYRKLNVHSRAELAHKALAAGLLDP